ncbi:MAG: 1-deoxy-D-xylulose-5-phosphate reductoisomerase [Defluviitaleaceae bacterium]|nr:1-deoxy-D-xylulose-5-phosphate reductoisomerase [Defluviitaleaceae bacterium]
MTNGLKIALLGATGSIGLQTLDVVRNCLPDAKIVAMSGYSNVELLKRLADEFRPERPEFVWTPAQGEDALIACAAESGADVVVNALVGRAGLAPTLAAINAGKNIALANKETLVTAGELVMNLAREKNVRITPIDSEHSAIWQCLAGTGEHGDNSSVSEPCVTEKPSPSPPTPYAAVEKIILTASGGPFRAWPREKIAAATAKDALKHPNWEMGAKITTDSATLMNKGLELIEAMHLFAMPPEKIEILVHPQSIIHSMVQFHDGSVMAQMGLPDMRLPILYALSNSGREQSERTARRVKNNFPRIDFLTCGDLTFEPPNEKNFPCLTLAKHAAKIGGTLPAVMNWLNEWAVGEFLRGKIGFYDISEIILRAFDICNVGKITCLEDIREAEAWAEQFVATAGRFGND